MYNIRVGVLLLVFFKSEHIEFKRNTMEHPERAQNYTYSVNFN